MPVSADVQAAISQLYAQLADSVTHAKPNEERAVLAPHFADKAKQKLETFEYDPLTVIIRRIDRGGAFVVVHATYVGVHGHNADTIDRWEQRDGQWMLLSRQ